MECSDEINENKVELAVLTEKFSNFEIIVGKIDSSIEKITEVNSNVSRMLAVHEERLSKQEQIDRTLLDKVDQLRDQVNIDHNQLSERLSILERKLWIAVGILGTVLSLTNPTALQIIKPLISPATASTMDIAPQSIPNGLY
jgi:chromosome segregation ATPase|tara:strand:- start:1590 stop:2015 length:426 start_codon:yes stop_codon:yes gene_type:complete